MNTAESSEVSALRCTQEPEQVKQDLCGTEVHRFKECRSISGFEKGQVCERLFQAHSVNSVSIATL